MWLASNTSKQLAALVFGLSIGCGGTSNNPNGITGRPGGQGGSGGATGGAGGAGGSSRGGTGGRAEPSGGSSSVTPDAGGVDQGGAAGTTTVGGGTDEPPVPEGCPEPTFIPAPGQVIGIQSVHFGRSEIVLRNVTDQPQTIIGGRQGWQWCNVPGYWSVVLPAVNVELAPGQTYAFRLIERDLTQRPLYDGSDAADTNEVGIYTTTGAFNNATLIEAFVSWGQGSQFETRESVASMGNKWNYGSRVSVQPGDAGFVATGDAMSGDGFTAVPDRCLPPRQTIDN